jgi:hypothetical protein
MTVRLRSSSHHRVEFELVDQRVTGLVVHGWDFRDDPQVDPPHRIWWPRSVLDDPTNNLAGLFEQFVEDGKAAAGSNSVAFETSSERLLICLFRFGMSQRRNARRSREASATR